MEVPTDVSIFFGDSSIVRLDSRFLLKYNQRKFPVLASLIDKMGRLSAEAQRLKKPLTSYEKLMDNEDHFVYLLWEHGATASQSVIVGMLKVGYKVLYLFDEKSRPFQAKALCILDFYVHTAKQRQGYGHRLFDYMLEREKTKAIDVAIDKPSESLLAFLAKHYGLKKPIWQNTNFVVYPEFFEPLRTVGETHEINWNTKDAQNAAANGARDGGIAFDSYQHERRPGSSHNATPTEDGNLISRPSSASTSSAQMAKGRKVAAMGHQNIWG